MVNLGDFLNEYAANSHVLSVWLVAVLIGLPVAAYFYNRFLDSLKGKEHSSLYVVGGNLFTILIAGLISWKAALLFLFLFVLDGLPMIRGEFKRTEKQEKVRVKRLPYKVNGYLKDTEEALELSHRFIGSAIDANEGEKHFEMLNRASHELTSAIVAIKKARSIQDD